jgi:hypothetical protein
LKRLLWLIVWMYSAPISAETEQCSGNIPSSEMKRIEILKPSKMDEKRGYKPAWMALERGYRSAVLNWDDETIREGYLGNRNAYLDVHMYQEMLSRLQHKYTKEIEVWEIARTHFGFPVYAILVGNSSSNEKADVLHLGGIHGNELLTVNYSLDALEALLGDSSEPIQNLKKRYNLWFIPMFNPDGNWLSMRRAHAESYGKKNGRNTDGTCETFGYEGVDLSKNFPKENLDIEIEPETQGLINLINSRQFVTALSYHTGGSGLYTPSLLPSEKEGERLLISSFTNDIHQGNPDLSIMPLRRTTELREIVWLQHQQGIPAFVYDSPSNIAPMQHEARAVARGKATHFTQSFWNSLEQRSVVMGIVVDQQNEPIQAEIRLDRGKKNDHVWETLENGQFALIFPSKEIFTLNIDMDGYVSAQKKIDLRSGSAKSRIVLRKEE